MIAAGLSQGGHQRSVQELHLDQAMTVLLAHLNGDSQVMINRCGESAEVGRLLRMELKTWPPIDSHAAPLNALEEHLEYCSCAYGTALPFMRDFLRLVVDQTDGVKDTERFRRASEGLVELLQGDGSPAM